ncbi:hypothetical protein VB711_06385 [Cronbergia sp. UHCC 0137]|nr:hypothetical protein [Cronbergia sp. UHCC 0137]MEA5617465.1 hypothetical protein [Cronbergia sp. UHCC 0137]
MSNENVTLCKTMFPKSSQLRPYGLCAGELTIPDDFDAEQILNSL